MGEVCLETCSSCWSSSSDLGFFLLSCFFCFGLVWFTGREEEAGGEEGRGGGGEEGGWPGEGR